MGVAQALLDYFFAQTPDDSQQGHR